MTHLYPKGNFVPKASLMKCLDLKHLILTGAKTFKSDKLAVNTARPINTAYPRPTVNSARTTSNVFNRAHSHVRRPFNNSTTNKNNNLKEKVNTVKGNVTTVGPIVAVSDNKGNEANAVKALACIKENIDAGQDGKKIVPDQEYILLPLLTSDPSLSKSSKDSPDAGFKPSGEEEKMDLKSDE
ncbi:hypothetical protein Tco_0319138 [Tanacetum coccineum]